MIDARHTSTSASNFIMNLIEKRDHLGTSLQFNLKNALWIIVAAGLIGGLITNASRIMDAIWGMRTDNAESITIPHLAVKLHNKGSQTISLPVQGECFLWPPEPHDWDYEGGYEFKLADGTGIDSEFIAIPAGSAREVQIHLKRTAPIHQTQTSLKRFYSTGDWHVQFLMMTDQYGRNLIRSARIPFTLEAMSKDYVFEVFRSPYRREALD